MKTFDQFRADCPHWQDYIHHDFVQQLGAGTLNKASFQHYLQQDYLFILQFTRSWALSIYKSDSFTEMRHGQAGVNAMLDMEIHLHIEYCKSWGINEEEMMCVPESTACIAYTRYVLDCAMSGGLPELYAALLPCVYGYAEIGRILAKSKHIDNNPYQAWINLYSGEEYQGVATHIRDHFDELCRDLATSQLNRLQHIFDTATRMEVAFWQMGLDCS